MKRKFIKLVVTKLLIACLVFSSIGMAFAATAETTTDIKGHWAEPEITAWIDKGFIKGYEDNSFKPNNSITRAEFIALVNRSFAFTEQAQISFSDVKTSNWAYVEIAKGVKAGYITGYADGTIGASKTISRQEVAVIVDRLLDLAAANSPSAFTDASKIGAWAKDAVDSAVAAGILKGYAEDNTFKPANPITRAEAVVTLDRANAPKNVVYNTAGTFGPATGNEVVNQDVVINASGVILQNMTLNGKLTFAAGIAQGDASLKNVTVKGETIVQGGGVNSIHLEDSVLATLTADKDASQGAVRIVAEGTTTVGQVNVNSPVTLQETNASGSGFGNVTLSGTLPAGSEVILKGSFDSVVVTGDGIKVLLAEGSVKSLTMSATSTGSTLDVAEGTTITALNLDAVTAVTGKGTITMATLSEEVQATGLQTFETAPGTVVVGTATPVPTATPAPGTGSGSGGNSGGGDTGGVTDPVVVSKAALIESISVAENVYSHAVVGDAKGQYKQTVVATVYSAIQAAKAVNVNTSATQSEVNSAVSTLDAAVVAFQDAVNPDNKALLDKIDVSQSVYDSAVVGTDYGQYKLENKTILQAAIDDAQLVADDKASTQPQLNAALNALTAALTAFENTVYQADKTALRDQITVSEGVYATVSLSVYLTNEDKDGFKTWITEAKDVVANHLATDNEVSDATGSLKYVTMIVNGAVHINIALHENADADTLFGFIDDYYFNDEHGFSSGEASNLKDWLRDASDEGTKVLTIEEIFQTLDNYWND